MQRKGEEKHHSLGADGALPVCWNIGGQLEQAERPGRRKQVIKENIFSRETTLPLIEHLTDLPKRAAQNISTVFLPSVSISAQTVVMKVNKKDMFI